MAVAAAWATALPPARALLAQVLASSLAHIAWLTAARRCCLSLQPYADGLEACLPSRHAGATDAARAAADIVLTEPGLSVVIDAIVIARQIFQRVKNFINCETPAGAPMHPLAARICVVSRLAPMPAAWHSCSARVEGCCFVE